MILIAAKTNITTKQKQQWFFVRRLYVVTVMKGEFHLLVRELSIHDV